MNVITIKPMYDRLLRRVDAPRICLIVRRGENKQQSRLPFSFMLE
jgi:hypothetical protein